MTNIDAKQAAAALSEIELVVRRVRQSRIYNLASLMLMLWGTLVFVGNVGSYLWPRQAGYLWVAINAAGVAGSIAISAIGHNRTGVRSFDVRMLVALLLFFAFGYLSCVLGHFGPRELGAFWPIYFMLVYTIVGLWIGPAFVAIGLGITALTLVGYFFVGAWFELWMAVVNGGGLVLGGLWMRRN
jgi:hypothetical protein